MLPNNQDGWLYVALTILLAVTALGIGIRSAKEARTGFGFFAWLIVGLVVSSAVCAMCYFVLRFVADTNAWTSNPPLRHP